MKVRNDFVTNSSSSSYIIAIKNDQFSDDAKIILDAILKCSWEDTSDAYLFSNDEEKLKEQLEDSYISEDEIEKIKQLIQNNWSVYQKNISYDDYALVDMFDILRKKSPETIKITSC